MSEDRPAVIRRTLEGSTREALQAIDRIGNLLEDFFDQEPADAEVDAFRDHLSKALERIEERTRAVRQFDPRSSVASVRLGRPQPLQTPSSEPPGVQESHIPRELKDVPPPAGAMRPASEDAAAYSGEEPPF